MSEPLWKRLLDETHAKRLAVHDNAQAWMLYLVGRLPVAERARVAQAIRKGGAPESVDVPPVDKPDDLPQDAAARAAVRAAVEGEVAVRVGPWPGLERVRRARGLAAVRARRGQGRRADGS